MYKHKKFNDKFPEYLPTVKKAPVNLKAIFKKRKEQVESLQLRRDIVQTNIRRNYRNEYDRMFHQLGHYKVPYKTMSQLEARDERLRT